ncbi:MAG: cytochrome b/b6 domain-containing protein [Candidatus Eisenbacteria sp.]|nr:cytochrome b/b6 domain-containing protein [Candidatus Eisenbacteria bacterium]
MWKTVNAACELAPRRWLGLLGFLVGSVGVPAAFGAPEPPPVTTGDCLGCHEVAGTGGLVLGDSRSLSVGGAQYEQSPHGILDCGDCHLGAESEPHPSEEMTTAGCATCHDTDEFDGSVHGRAKLPGPGCLWCHDPHAPVPADSLTAGSRVLLCSQCHEDEALMVSHGVGLEWARGYRQSFHGRSIRLGDKRVADCVACHTAHNVRSSQDPASTTHIANLLQTCSATECHPRATPAFLRGSSHAIYGGKKGALIGLVRGFYMLVIAGLISAMFLHNVLDFRARRRAGFHPDDGASHTELSGTVLRWTLGERIQHGLLIGTFLILAVSGLVLKVPGGLPTHWPAAEFLMSWRGELHRWAAAIFIALGLYHLRYIAVSRRGREQRRKMSLSVADLRELAGTIWYLLGKRSERPSKGRFGYVEKMEYFALLCGGAVMTVSGFVLWVEEIWPLFIVDLARVIHAWEAILAILAVGVWHLYNAHWRPGIFPMDRSWLDGRIRIEDLKRDHREEYERLRSR